MIAQDITGIANKKEKHTLLLRERPANKPIVTVTPNLDTPGIRENI